jgi:hypothetical protein
MRFSCDRADADREQASVVAPAPVPTAPPAGATEASHAASSLDSLPPPPVPPEHQQPASAGAQF